MIRGLLKPHPWFGIRKHCHKKSYSSAVKGRTYEYTIESIESRQCTFSNVPYERDRLGPIFRMKNKRS